MVDNNEIFITKILFNFLLSRPPPTPPPQHPANQLLEGRSGISHGVLLPGISGLSFPFFNFFFYPPVVFLPGPLALSVLSFFC